MKREEFAIPNGTANTNIPTRENIADVIPHIESTYTAVLCLFILSSSSGIILLIEIKFNYIKGEI